MLLVVLVHANYYSLGAPTREDILSSPYSSFFRVFAEQVCVPGVDIFILISGWFGIHPTRKGICSLFFQVLFYGVLIFLIGHIIDLHIPLRDCLKVFFFGGYYWFVAAYVGLYAFSPVLNSFVEHTPPKQIRSVLLAFFAIEFIFGWITDMGSYIQGYSFISFIGLYLLARYLRQYPDRFSSLAPIQYWGIFLVSSLIPAFLSFFGIAHNLPQFNPIHYSSLFVILAALALLLAFSKMHFSNRIINWIACSSFSVYLVHFHPIVIPHLKYGMVSLSDSMNCWTFAISAFGLALLFFVVCVLIDKIRITCWNIISCRIR